MSSPIATRTAPFALVALVALVAPACHKILPQPSQPSADEAPRSPAERAQALFSSRCASCHGPQGRGDGPASGGLSPRPRNFSDPSWHARATDAHLRKVITEGGASVGLSAMMPPAADLAQDAALRDALVAYVRTLMTAR